MLQIFMAWLTLNWSWPAFLVALYVVGATANHSLFLAIHELAHNLGASTSLDLTLSPHFLRTWGNKAISLMANFPIAIPYAINFKPYHMEPSRHVELLALLAAVSQASQIPGTGGRRHRCAHSTRRVDSDGYVNGLRRPHLQKGHLHVPSDLLLRVGS